MRVFALWGQSGGGLLQRMGGGRVIGRTKGGMNTKLHAI